MKPTSVPRGWRKSSYTKTSNCVEVGRIDIAGVVVRDSKNPSGGYFSATARQWGSFIDRVRAGHFDL
jgi:hypothetical protein